MIRVVCAIIEQNSRFLAAHRSHHQSQGLLWEFPGGKIEPGEQPEDALIREINEELGCCIKTGASLTPVIFEYPGKPIELIPFICCIVEGIPVPHEHAEIRWIDIVQAKTLAWAPADVPIVNEYIQRLKKGSTE